MTEVWKLFKIWLTGNYIFYALYVGCDSMIVLNKSWLKFKTKHCFKDKIL